jgi:hypothetical protein
MPTGDTLNVNGPLSATSTITATAGQSELGNLNLGVLTPAAITGTVNDWSPVNWTNATTTVIEVSLSGATTLNSLVALNAGSTVTLCNMSATFDLTIPDAATASGGTAANQFENQGGLIKLSHHAGPEPECANYIYDNTLTKWMGTSTTASTIHNLTISSGLSVQSSGATISGGTQLLLSTAGFTANETDANVNNSSTFDTTAGPLTSIGIACTNTSSRSAGANNLTDICGQFNASGGQVNQALLTLAGDVVLNQTSGGAFLEGGSTFSGGRTVLSTGAARIADTAPAAGLGGNCTSGGGSSITAGEAKFTVTVGASSTACTITFATALTSTTPTCTVSPRNGTNPGYSLSTNVSITLTAVSAGAVYDIDCTDH